MLHVAALWRVGGTNEHSPFDLYSRLCAGFCTSPRLGTFPVSSEVLSWQMCLANRLWRLWTGKNAVQRCLTTPGRVWQVLTSGKMVLLDKLLRRLKDTGHRCAPRSHSDNSFV